MIVNPAYLAVIFRSSTDKLAGNLGILKSKTLHICILQAMTMNELMCADASSEEVYTEEHINLLGDFKEEW